MHIDWIAESLLRLGVKGVELRHDGDIVLGSHALPVGDQVVGLGVADHLINRIVGTGDVEADFKPGFCRQHTENTILKILNHDRLPPD